MLRLIHFTIPVYKFLASKILIKPLGTPGPLGEYLSVSDPTCFARRSVTMHFEFPKGEKRFEAFRSVVQDIYW